MCPSDIESQLDDMFGSLSALAGKDTATLVSQNSSEVNLTKLVNDHIYGLLLLEELSPGQIQLLNALMQFKG